MPLDERRISDRSTGKGVSIRNLSAFRRPLFCSTPPRRRMGPLPRHLINGSSEVAPTLGDAAVMVLTLQGLSVFYV